MQAFKNLDAVAVPMARPNVDTDQIVPARYLRKPRKLGFGDYLFRDLRLDKDGRERDFVLNKLPYREAKILVAERNFGCGSSREHAPWALLQYGFQAVIAPSFADIFYNNSLKNGLLLIKLDEKTVDRLFREAGGGEGYRLAVDLESQTVTTPGGESFKFDIDPFAKHSLLNGLDEIGLTLEHAAEIRAFETKHRERQPWLFG